MIYNPPTGAGSSNESFVGKNVGAGIQGSRVPPAAIELPQREIVNVIVGSGQAPTNEDNAQLLKGIRGGKLWSFVDAGSVNQIVINPPVVHVAATKSLFFRIWPSYTNTSAVTLQVNSMGALPLLRRDGTPVLAGDIVVGIPIEVVNDGLGNYRLASFAMSEVARIISSPVFYVRTDGNDNNDGQGNTSDRAFATIKGAILNGANKLTLAGRVATIILGQNGTYAAPSFPGIFPNAEASLSSGGTLVIAGYAIQNGDTTQQNNYIISGTGAAGMSGIIHASYGTQLILRGLRLQNDTTSFYHTLSATTNAAVYCEYVTFGGLGSSTGAHVFAADSGICKVGPGCIIASSSARAFYVLGGVITQQNGAQLTLAGTLAFSDAFAKAEAGQIRSQPGFTGGSITGKRYDAINNGVILTSGGGANYFPGSVAGTYSNGGIYA